MGRVVDTLLHSLTDRLAALAAPSDMHPDAWPLGERLEAWGRGSGLVLGDPDTSPLGRGRFERLAARVFPAGDLERVELFARWLTWTFAVDDLLDDAPMATSATAVHGLYGDLLKAMRRGHAAPGARPLEATAVELWRAAAAGMSRDWRRRFLLHMEEHRAGCAAEAVGRRMGETPTPDAYPALRRRAAGPFLLDLIEPVLGVELPPRLLGTSPWKTVAEGTADVLAWSNDLASYGKETARGDVHNHVVVLAAARGLEPAQAADRVVDHIVDRVMDVRGAVRAMNDTFAMLGLSPAERDAVTRIVGAFVGAPRAHLDWLTESGRYCRSGVPDQASPAPGQRQPRLDALASLR
ncbi:terpene synthase family protein [Spirillospora sp. NPDC048911]|uniref:terpene synthase family protein n=1 Tax=Spirillospora sp. NPDC048911 TaxID=3364527 RepID=UPI00371EE3C4